jgi:ribonuclease I
MLAFFIINTTLPEEQSDYIVSTHDVYTPKIFFSLAVSWSSTFCGHWIGGRPMVDVWVGGCSTADCGEAF